MVYLLSHYAVFLAEGLDLLIIVDHIFELRIFFL